MERAATGRELERTSSRGVSKGRTLTAEHSAACSLAARACLISSDDEEEPREMTDCDLPESDADSVGGRGRRL